MPIFSHQIDFNSYQAFLFDLDGTLIDGSDRHFIECVCETGKEFGHENLRIPPGKPLGDFVREHFDEADDDLIHRFRARNRERMISTPRPVRFHDDTLEFMLRFENKERAIVTNCCDWELELTEQNLDLRQYFEVVVYNSPEIKGKPAGDLYLAAAKKLQIDPKHCLVFEDSQTGIRSGKNAGMTVVAIDRGVHTDFEGADMVIRSFRELF